MPSILPVSLSLFLNYLPILLKGEKELDDHVIHLLFSTNRWEKREELTKALDAGQHVLIDRYAYSGVAFSAAKAGMDLDWCRGPDRGLPKPGKDIVSLNSINFSSLFSTFYSHIQQGKIIERLNYLLLCFALVHAYFMIREQVSLIL